jgi:hypothetical protein
MYLPYLYGRQSELLALRSAATQYFSSGVVVPVIEPVVAKFNAVARCLEELGKNEHQAVVIMNPYQGELKGGAGAQWKKEIDTVLAKFPSLLPGFLCRQETTAANAQTFLKKYAGRDVALLYLNSGLSDTDMKTYAATPNVRYHICLQGRMTAAHRKLLPKSKAVNILDNFNKQPRNADYSGVEHFTDSHKDFTDSGIGFGDYTVIGSEMLLGGGPPGAVAIHATYKNADNDDIWVEHFVSDETDVAAGTAESKYLEAVAKLANEHPPREHEFGLNPALEAYFADHLSGHFPGLGKNKERQIHHHIALMHDVLTEEI